MINMRLKCITCEALARPVYLCAASSPHVIDVELLHYGLHNQPADLRAILQDKIDASEGNPYDYVTLAYGLCGKASAGLQSRSIPLVSPRAHDCITLFLGSRARYQEQFENYPGTYWYSQDYIERNDGSNTILSLGSAELGLQSTYQEYVEKYGVDNADYLMEVMGAWQQHYQRAVYIDLGVGYGKDTEQKAISEASRRGWSFERINGDLILIKNLLDGKWNNRDYLKVSPGQEIKMTGDEGIVGCSTFGTNMP